MIRIAPIFSSSEMEQISDFQYKNGLNTKAGAVKALVNLALNALNSPCFQRYCQVNNLTEEQAMKSLTDCYRVFDNMVPLQVVDNTTGKLDHDIVILKRIPETDTPPRNGTIAK